MPGRHFGQTAVSEKELGSRSVNLRNERMKKRQAKQKIARISDLSETHCKQFIVEDENGLSYSAFIIKRGGLINAYKNSCPHLQVELNWLPDQFLNYDNSHIICAMHGALFRLEDGLCVQGPCVMQKLQAISIVVRGDDIYISD